MGHRAGAFLLLVTVPGVSAVADTSSRACGSESDSAEPFVTEVAPGHFVHVGLHEDMTLENRGNIATSGFVVGTKSVAVIDPGGSSSQGRRLARSICERTSLPVSHVILTHFHPDHVLAAHVFEDVDQIVAHEHYLRSVVQRGAFYLDRYAALLDADATLAAPSLTIAAGNRLELDLGRRVLTLQAWTTAHTDNDLSVFDEDAGVLWSGDLTVASRTPSLDGSLPGWLSVLEEVSRLESSLIVPGHGEASRAASVLERLRGYLALLLGNTRRQLANGENLPEVLSAAERADADGWKLFGLHHPTNVTKAWIELEWE